MKPVYFLLILLTMTIFFLSHLFDPFIRPLFIALLLTIATHNLHSFLSFRISNGAVVSMLTTISLALLFFVPVLYFIFTFANFLNEIDQRELIALYENIKNWVENIPEDLIFLKMQLATLLEKIKVPDLVTSILSVSAYIGKNSATFMADTLLTLIFYFFFNLYGKSLQYYIKEVLPLKIEDSTELFFEVSNVMSIVFYSILVTAIFEGVLFGVFISFYGYDGILLGVLYGFASLIPVIGGMLMWVPISAYELFNGTLSDAIAIALYTIIVISIIADTFIKPIIIRYINKKIVKTPSSINELLIFFSIVAGLSTFGFWGMIIGPATVTFFISLLQMLKKYKEN